MDWIYFICFND